MSVELEELLREGAAAARAGAREEARRLFQQAIEIAPESVDAWLGLAGVVDDLAEKRSCLERALAIDPDNAEAQAGLAWLERGTSPKQDEHEHTAETVEEPAELYCVNHPNRSTLLRCNKCGRPVCMDCVQLTDVGYRCKDCINRVRASFYNISTLDYPVAVLVSFLVTAAATPVVGVLARMLGFWGFWIALFLGPAAGGALAEIIRQAVGRRRGRYLWLFAGLGVLLGVLMGNAGLLLVTGIFPLLNLPMLFFLGLALSTVYARLR